MPKRLYIRTRPQKRTRRTHARGNQYETMEDWLRALVREAGNEYWAWAIALAPQHSIETRSRKVTP